MAKSPEKNRFTFSLLLYDYSLILILTFTIILNSCGIDTYPYPDPPALDTIEEPIEGGSVFRFGNTPNNNVTFFEGFEVYYKFYSAIPEHSTFKKYEADIITLENSPTLAKLKALNFTRFYSDTLKLPLIPINSEIKKDVFSIYIDFSNMGLPDKPYPEVRYLDQTFPIFRYVREKEYEILEEKGFLPEDFSSDYMDIDGTYYNSQYQHVYLVLFVLAYGKSDLIYDLYSKPAYLGRIRITTQ
ncbi:MAG: hypothetical protein AB1798_14045 [Spirochaetota bacterium]